MDEAAAAVRPSGSAAGAPSPPSSSAPGSAHLRDRVADARHAFHTRTFPASRYRRWRGTPASSWREHSRERWCCCRAAAFICTKGHSAHTAAFAVRVFASLGIDTLILTNAAGGIRRGLAAGTRHADLGSHQPELSQSADRAASCRARNAFPTCRTRTIRRCGDRRDSGDCARGWHSPKACTCSCSGRATRHRPRSACSSGSAPTRWECRRQSRSWRRGPGACGVSASRRSPIRPPAFCPVKLNHVEVMETARRVAGELGTIISGVVAEL